MTWKTLRYLIGVVAGLTSLWLTLSVAADRLAEGTATTLVYLPFVTKPQSVNLTGQECPAWVHDTYKTTAPDGKSYPTWHPPLDPVYKCYFSHEHGSDPHTYVGFSHSGMPAFGYVGAQAQMDEPHVGFKVYVANNDLLGRAWLIVLHQGTGGPKRASTQHHSVYWDISTTSGQKLVNVGLMADFGYASPNCDVDRAIPGSASGYPFDPDQVQRRTLPTTDCVDETPYETWTPNIDLAGVFRATPMFDIDNATTVINVNNLTETRYMCEFRSPNENCTTANTQWTGNKRGVIHPGQYVRNRGTAQFYTDVFGRKVNAGTAGAIPQFVTTSGWDSRDCCGKDVEFHIQRNSNGVYVAASLEDEGRSQFGIGKHHWPN